MKIILEIGGRQYLQFENGSQIIINTEIAKRLVHQGVKVHYEKPKEV